VLTNDDVAPTLTIKKVTVLTDGTVIEDPQAFNFTSADLGDFSLDTDSNDNTLSDTKLFNDLRGDTSYTVDETAADNWSLDSIDCGGEDVQAIVTDTGVTVNPRVGQNVTCTFTNTKQPTIQITKANDRPNPTTVGDTVTYTLTITVPENSGGTVYDTAVTDLPPKNFTFIPGSWTASSTDVLHNLTIRDQITEGSLDDGGDGNPTYGSPGTWHIGNLVRGEVVTLTYKANIGATVSPGTYPDLAFVAGFNQPTGGNRILGNLSFADTPFVGTNVSIKAPAVLGATILVNTGTSLSWAEFVIPVLLVAGVYITRRLTVPKGGQS
jgi:fimbrial isopeptide formation D2 family protein